MREKTKTTYIGMPYAEQDGPEYYTQADRERARSMFPGTQLFRIYPSPAPGIPQVEVFVDGAYSREQSLWLQEQLDKEK